MRVSSSAMLPGVHDLDAFLRAGHKAVLGKTRSGKSKLLEYWMDETSLRVVYVNPHKVPLKAALARSPGDVLKLIARGERRIQWQPPREHEVAGGKKAILHQFGVMVAGLFQLGRKLMGRKDKAAPWLLLIVDEAQLFTSKTGSIGPVEMVLTEGAKFGIVAANASQRPARTSHEVMGQAGQTCLFRLNPEDLEILRARKYPVDEFKPWLERDFHFVMLDGERWVAFDPVPV